MDAAAIAAVVVLLAAFATSGLPAVAHAQPAAKIPRIGVIGVREAARTLGLDVQLLEIRHPEELAPAFSTLSPQRVDAILALSDPVFGSQLEQLAALAARHRLPAMYARKEFAAAGGLLSFGPGFSANYRRAASYVDRILKGAKRGEPPVEQSIQFELVINAKAAKSLGIAIPLSLAQRADQLIE